MPFTPFHWGPILFLGLMFFPSLDLPSLLISSVSPDVEGFLIISLNPLLPHHGFVHTYLAASLMGFLAAAAAYSLRRWTGRIMAVFHLRQASSFRRTVLTSLLGAYSHIFLDSLLYPEMAPLYPLKGNLFLLKLPEYVRFDAVYGLCSLFFLIALIMYVKRSYRA